MQRSHIGKVVGERKANFNVIKMFMDGSYSSIKRIMITEIRQNMFQFNFELEDKIGEVVNGTPWIFDNQMLVLKK